MATELDNALTDIMDALVAPWCDVRGWNGAAFPGRRYHPSIKGAPSLAHYFAHFCNEHKDTTFIVDGDIRRVW
jgi:hypothetical protein